MDSAFPYTIDTDGFLDNATARQLADFIVDPFRQICTHLDGLELETRLAELPSIYEEMSAVIVSFSGNAAGRPVWYRVNKAKLPYRAPDHAQSFGLSRKNGHIVSIIAASLDNKTARARAQKIRAKRLADDFWLSLCLGFVGHGAMSSSMENNEVLFHKCVVSHSQDCFDEAIRNLPNYSNMEAFVQIADQETHQKIIKTSAATSMGGVQ